MTDRIENEAEIIAAVKKGYSQAFQKLVEKYWQKLHNFIRRMVDDPSLVEDFCQETFLKAFKKFDQFDASRKFSPWLFKIAVNHICEYFRQKNSKVQFVLYDQSELSKFFSNTTDSVEERIFLEGLIERLPLDLKMIFLLRHAVGLSYEEMSQILDQPLGTIKGSLFRARGALKSYLEGISAFEKVIGQEVKNGQS